MNDSATALLALREHGAGAFAARVSEPLCAGPPGRQFLFGGIALAAAVEAMERHSGRPALFASAQFLTQARPGDALRFVTEVAADGRAVKQCRVTASRGAGAFLHVQGACGGQADGAVHRGALMPDVPPPDACAGRSVARRLSSNLNALLEFRLAAGTIPDRADWTGPGGADLACWIRARSGAPLDRLLLTVVADCAALALDGALGRPASGSSLDNVIRFAAAPAGDWTLATMQVDAIEQGMAHVTTRLFSDAGALLAVAGQSMRLRG